MHRAVAALVAGSLAPILAACGSSTQTVTGPNTNKCAVTATADTSSFGAGGGSGNITVSTNRECQWTAQSSTSWVSLGSGSTGQGDGKIPFTVAANADPSARRGTVSVNDQQVSITEDAAPCQFTVSPLADTVSSGGDRRTIAVTVSSAQCTWAAKSNTDWISIASGAQGTGNGTVVYNAQATTGPTRIGSVTVAGQTVAVTQGTGCSVVISPTGASIGAAGGNGSVSVSAGTGCTWTATTSDSWITLTSGATGTGAGTVAFTVPAWNGPARTGTISVNGQPFTISQGAGCAFSLSTSSTTVGAGGGSGSFVVHAGAGCSWSASASQIWVHVIAGSNGAGDGTVQFTVDTNAGLARDAAITVAGQTFSIHQNTGCSYSLSATSVTSPYTGATGTVSVTTGSSCTWTASAPDSWARITAGTSGTGNGTVQFVVDPNSGGSRTSMLTIAGIAFTISQDPMPAPCTYSISPTSANYTDAAAHAGTFALTASASTCGWTATPSDPSWIQVTSTTTGTGSATISYSIAANAGPTRSGTISIGGQAFTISQASGCTISITPTSQIVDAIGGGGTITVTTSDPACGWVATPDVPWITISAGASGTGNGTVTFAVAPNTTGAARAGHIDVSGQTFTVNQN